MRSGQCVGVNADDTTESPIRIVVVDDDAGIRLLLEVTLDLDPRFLVVGVAASAFELRQQLSQMRTHDEVDVVLLDVTLPDADGIDLLAEVRELAPGARVALFTGWRDSETTRRARAAGADAMFEKTGNSVGLLDELSGLAIAARH